MYIYTLGWSIASIYDLGGKHTYIYIIIILYIFTLLTIII